MAHKIIMPKQGLQMTEGTITKWLKKEGESVKKGEPLFEMETDKLNITIESSAEGVLLKVVRHEGEVVPITETIAIIGARGEDISLFAAETKASPQSAEPSVTVVPQPEAKKAPATGSRIFITPRARMRAGERGIDAEQISGSGPDNLIIESDVLSFEPVKATKATPLAKKTAEMSGVSLEGLSGTGSRGKIMAADVRDFVSSKMRAASEKSRGEVRRPFSGMRKIIAARMKQSLNDTAQLNHKMDVDMTEALRLREQFKSEGIKVSFNDIVIRAAAQALTEFPEINVSIDGSEIVVKEYVNIGVAVALENGLIVPVIRDADLMNLPQIASSARDLASRAKENRLAPDEYTGGTFTVTNLGMFDVDSFTAIINPPEAAILAVGRINKKPVVVDEDIVIRPIMNLCLTYDHMAVDGAPAARFLRRIKALLESPGLMI